MRINSNQSQDEDQKKRPHTPTPSEPSQNRVTGKSTDKEDEPQDKIKYSARSQYEATE